MKRSVIWKWSVNTLDSYKWGRKPKTFVKQTLFSTEIIYECCTEYALELMKNTLLFWQFLQNTATEFRRCYCCCFCLVFTRKYKTKYDRSEAWKNCSEMPDRKCTVTTSRESGQLVAADSVANERLNENNPNGNSFTDSLTRKLKRVACLMCRRIRALAALHTK